MERRPQRPTVGNALAGTVEGDKGPGTRGNDQGPIDVGETQEHASISQEGPCVAGRVQPPHQSTGCQVGCLTPQILSSRTGVISRDLQAEPPLNLECSSGVPH